MEEMIKQEEEAVAKGRNEAITRKVFTCNHSCDIVVVMFTECY